MQGNHRTTLARVRHIVAKLQKGDPVNATILAQEFGVSTKTVQRDMDFLRHLGHEISYDKKRYTFAYLAIPHADDVLAKQQETNLSPLLAAVDKALSDPRFFWEWEHELREARAKFPKPHPAANRQAAISNPQSNIP